MQYKNQLITLVALGLCGGLGYTLGTFSVADNPVELSATTEEEVSRITISYPIPPEIPKYTLKEYQGKIGVFMGNKEEPDLVLEQYVHLLPDVDRQALREGIPVEDYDQLLSCIDDYTN